MKKPSTQIIEMMEGLQEDPNNLGTFAISSEQRAEIVALCKQVDKRDQQYRKGQKPKPAAAKKKARR
jgi:hypothetical protein